MAHDDREPGTRFRRFAERTFDRATLDRVILPAIADLQHECADDAGATRAVRLRAYWGLWKTLAVCVLAVWARDSRPAAEGVAARMAVIFPIVIGIVMVPAVNLAWFGKAVAAPLLLMSLPQAVAMALPIALFFAITLEQRATSLPRLVPVVFAMALACSVVMMTITFFVVPRANHAYATSVHEHLKAAGRPDAVSFGAGEWTFTELVEKARHGTPERDRAFARRALGMRLATSSMPIVLGFVALGIAGYPRRHALVNGMWLLMFYAAALLSAGSSSFTGPSVRGVCMVNTAFLLAGLGMVWLRPNPLDNDSEEKGTIIS